VSPSAYRNLSCVLALQDSTRRGKGKETGLCRVYTSMLGIKVCDEGFSSRIEGLSSRIEGLSSRIEGLSSRIEGLSSRIEGLSSRIEGFEGRKFRV